MALSVNWIGTTFLFEFLKLSVWIRMLFHPQTLWICRKFKTNSFLLFHILSIPSFQLTLKAFKHESYQIKLKAKYKSILNIDVKQNKQAYWRIKCGNPTINRHQFSMSHFPLLHKSLKISRHFKQRHRTNKQNCF